jgi:hypothetical protein
MLVKKELYLLAKNSTLVHTSKILPTIPLPYKLTHSSARAVLVVFCDKINGRRNLVKV